MEYQFSEVILIIIVGTVLLLSLGIFVTVLLFTYKNRYLRYQQNLVSLQETYQRELLQSQIEIQNHTLQQVAQELHDNIGQLLTVVVMRLNSLEDDVKEPKSEQSVQQTRDLVRTIITEVRTLSKTLDYDNVQRFGFLPSLTLELERIQRAGHIQTQLHTTGEPYSLGEQAETVLLRMAQESLNNALKHAHAHQLTVSVDYQPETFTLMLTDDGEGFRLAETTTRTLDKSGSGLSNLRRRAGLLGGICTITSESGVGTCVEIKLPGKQTV